MKKNNDEKKVIDINQITTNNLKRNEIIDINYYPSIENTEKLENSNSNEFRIYSAIKNERKENDKLIIDLTKSEPNFYNKQVSHFPQYQINENRETKSIYCENCRNSFSLQIEYDNHLGICFLKSDYNMNDNIELEDFNNNYYNNFMNMNSNQVNNNFRNDSSSMSFPANIEEKKIQEEIKEDGKDLKCEKCRTKFFFPYLLDLHLNSCKGKKWDEELIVNESNTEFNIPNDSIYNLEKNYPNPSMFEYSSEMMDIPEDVYISRRMNDFNGDLNIPRVSIPGIMRNHDQIFSQDNRNLYSDDQSFEEGSYESELSYDQLLELDENIIHPLGNKYIEQLVEEKITKIRLNQISSEDKKCLICMDDYHENEIVLRLPCLHNFHKQEVLEWFKKKKTCPVCRSNVEEMIKKISKNNLK